MQFRVQVAADSKAATGWYHISLPGKVKGIVYIDAARPSKDSPWNFKLLRVEIDPRMLEARAAARRAVAERAGYNGGGPTHSGQGVDGAAATAASASPTLPLAESADGSGAQVVTFDLTLAGPRQAAADKASSGAKYM